jgi:hypothetical protein
VSRNGSSDIPGAPTWVRHFFQRIDDRFDVFGADLELAVKEFRGVRSKVAELEERTSKAEAEIVELREYVRRSLTPQPMPAVTSEPPDEVA